VSPLSSAVYHANTHGELPLHHACVWSNSVAVRLLLQRDSTAAFKADNRGNTPLHAAQLPWSVCNGGGSTGGDGMVNVVRMLIEAQTYYPLLSLYSDLF